MKGTKMKRIKNLICIFLVFIICFAVCACSKTREVSVEETESIAPQTIGTSAAEATDTNITSAKAAQSRAEISTDNKQTKPTRSTTTTKYVKPTYASTIDGYVTIPNHQPGTPDTEEKTVYVITDVKSNISGKIRLSGIELTVDKYSGAVLYVNYTVKPDNNLYENCDYTIQKLENGQWTDFEQIREIDPGKTSTLSKIEKITYSLHEYYHLDKYFNNVEDGRYKLKPNFCTDIEMKNSAGYEIEFTVTKKSVKEAEATQKIENPVSANIRLASYSTNYTYTLFDSRQLTRVTQLYNSLGLSPIEKPKTLYGSYMLTVIDSSGYEHSLILYNGGIVVSKNGCYYFAENGNELFDYFEAIHLNT